jgi:hypothetical protein
MAYWIGVTCCRDYADVWFGDFAITFWFDLACWQARVSRWGLSFGPFDVQWGS